MNIWLPTALCVSTLILAGCNGSSDDNKTNTAPSQSEVIHQQIRDLINTTMAQDQIPGMSLALVSDQDVLFAEGFGVREQNQPESITPDTPFWLGSVSKAVMGTAITHAMENQLLDLTTPITSTLNAAGSFTLATPEADNMALIHLVTHISGIEDDDNYDCAYFYDNGAGQTRYLAEDFSDLSCNASVPTDMSSYLRSYLSADGAYYDADNFNPPGEEHEYSNIASALAGYTLQLATGQSLADYAQANLFSPMGMLNTSWKLSDFDISRIAVPHIRNGNGGLISLPFYSLSTWPDGGLRSSANDLAMFLQMVMNQGNSGGVQILRPDSVELMQSNIIGDDNEAYGIFWNTTTMNGRVLKGHTGSDPGAFSFMLYDPATQLGVVLIANGDDNFAGMDTKYFGIIEQLLQQAEKLK
ncbi:serine hydrolase domain-containing protein [Oceanospirillum sediminis]|uniref:Beta-lactamase family protein n=1 Tax=Oceanospirillum sediminis TaxID=2760088 RepID=A0A839IQZ8_9GAMM|nr:serine hydrolase domain-containing protein [Oceanospirillum sediminis]MBB1487130.1 beta-lactamase family protein [Oceanospirillum sediminis]